MPDAIGVDVGGTNVRVAHVGADGVVDEVRRAPTPFGDAAALVATVGDLVGDATGPVGVGVAGGATADGTLRGGPNLGMDGAAIGPMLAARLGRPATIINDADAATWAEHRVGAGTGVEDLVMLTVGTGVGGGVVVGDRLLRGSTGLGAELGHIIVHEGGAPCACGNLGCLEAYASGSAMALQGRRGSEVAAAARAGDEAASAHLERVGTWLGIGIATLVNVFDPQVVLIGGGAGSAAFGELLPATEAAMRARIFARDHREAPPIVRARLGDDAGVIGAALLALEEARR